MGKKSEEVVSESPEAEKACRCDEEARRKGDAERQAEKVSRELKQAGA